MLSNKRRRMCNLGLSLREFYRQLCLFTPQFVDIRLPVVNKDRQLLVDDALEVDRRLQLRLLLLEFLNVLLGP